MNKNRVVLFLLSAGLLDVLLWGIIFFGGPVGRPELYFLDVGQGDSELVVLPGGVKMLIDGGPTNNILRSLDRALPTTSRYIDLVMLSHAQTDHMEGLIEVFQRYGVGAFLWNGRAGMSKSFEDVGKAVRESGTRVVVLGRGDVIRIGESRFDILSPAPDLLGSDELNDTTLVTRLTHPDIRVLFTGDIGVNVEDRIIADYGYFLVDVLKIPHHGSRFSSSEGFLRALKPRIAVIEVGAKNTYHHPTEEVLGRLRDMGIKTFRTDRDGTIKIAVENGRLDISKTGK
ncbi:hypothetical protein HY504_03425 [Candidatus Wolfebacteria bacterium]|nr:hypothetical protein [Candidatus Wolfebacteria bacterium]